MRREDRIEGLSRQFHARYEENASRSGWETQAKSQVAWEDVPEANREATRKTVEQVVGPQLDKIDRLRARVAELEAAIRLVQDMHVPEISGYEAHCHICSPRDGDWPCLVRMELDAVVLPPEEEQR